MTTARPATGGSRGGVGRIVAAVIVVLVALVIIGRLTADQRTNIPFDTASSSPSGTKALVDLLSGFDTDVDVLGEFPGEDTDIAVIFEDVVPTARLDDVERWVAEGHTLVVTYSSSDFAPDTTSSVATTQPGGTVDAEISRGRCTIDALRDVNVLDEGRQNPYGRRFRDNGDDPVCFAGDRAAFVTLTPMGKGRIVSIASGFVFVNAYLGRADNAVLAAQLMAPRPGTRVGVITEAAFPGDESGSSGRGDTFGRLITPGIQFLLLQMGVALLLYGLARGRRLGRPVAEPQPVQIAGSELVGAVGNLLQQMKQPDNAALVLRTDVRRELCLRLGLPPHSPPTVIADSVAARTDVDRDRVLAAIADQTIVGDAELVALAQNLDTIRTEVLHGHAP